MIILNLKHFVGKAGLSSVMAGLVPAIHVFLRRCCQDVDARDKPGHDQLT
jgi:hypothetical protein